MAAGLRPEMYGASPISVAADWGRAPTLLDYVDEEGVAAKAWEIEPKDTVLWNSSAVYGGPSERTGGEEGGELSYCAAGGGRGTIQPLKRFNTGTGTGTPVTNTRVKEIRKIAAPKKHARSAARAAGRHTLQEIFSQPAIWAETARQLQQQGALEHLSKKFSAENPWLFVACGSSYYLSQMVAAIWAKYFLIPCAAVPASEFLFAPPETLQQAGARQAVLVSRSGETTKVLHAAELLKSHAEIRTLGVTCNIGGPLENLCTQTMKLTWADEKSTVMTRSFTSMLLAFQRLGARLANRLELAGALDGLPGKVQAWLDENATKIQVFAAKRRFADYVFLGQGTHYWLAQEGALKITEMSSSYAQAYHTLEFRYGPRSIAGRDTLITFFLSDAAAEEEALLVSELENLGAATMIITNRAIPALKRSGDLLIEMGIDEPEFARLAPMAIPAHLLGTAVGLRKGLNPDAPKNLTRAVVLGTNGSGSAKRRDA
jgi:glutamine---fructose-6-phosphate transaminase (isomerizing)